MRHYVNILKVRKDARWDIGGFYHHGRKYLINEIANPTFVDGVTSFDITVAGKKTKLYLDEIDKRWFVIPKVA